MVVMLWYWHTGMTGGAVEAGAHAYVSRKKLHWPLYLDGRPRQRQLHGRMTLPMPIATKGGSHRPSIPQ